MILFFCFLKINIVEGSSQLVIAVEGPLHVLKKKEKHITQVLEEHSGKLQKNFLFTYL